MRPTIALSCVIAAACGGAPPAVRPSESAAIVRSDPSAPIVRTLAGLVRGRAVGASAAFRGIPYAAPPVGDLRWRAPAPTPKWDGVREATGFGYACMQSPSSFEPNGTPLGSEDCLTLNVFTPNLHPTGPMPVLVFVHGGFFTWGSASKRVEGADLYDGQLLATKLDAIVVTLNYRLGPLGWIAHPAFEHEAPQGGSGNYGLEDQIAALEWVKANVAFFGGDPGRVTLSGHSAGAITTLALVASPRAKGLFARAIAFSGNGYAKPRGRALDLGKELARRLGCDGAKDVGGCMRSRSASDVVAAMPESFADGNGYATSVDGFAVPTTPLEAFRSKRAEGVPVILGTTSDEFSTMAHTILKKAPITVADVAEVVSQSFGVGAGAIVARYPLSSYASAIDAVVHLWGDATFVCPTRLMARAMAGVLPRHVWRFVFAHAYRAPDLRPLGAGHGLELPLLFRRLPESFRMSAEETALGDQFTDAIGHFVRDGDPGAGSVTWAPYDAESDSYLEIDTPPSPKSGARSAECDFWDARWKL